MREPKVSKAKYERRRSTKDNNKNQMKLLNQFEEGYRYHQVNNRLAIQWTL
jgi:hypothetical protein